jgi:DNA-binding MarR family transcriptional regulator
MTMQTLSTRTIGETENALRAILSRGLAGTGLNYPQWVALKATAESPAPRTTEDLAAFLQDGLKIDEDVAGAALDALRASGHLAQDGHTVAVTPSGASLFGRLNEQFVVLSGQMYAGLGADELATAQRVLSTITERANALVGGLMRAGPSQDPPGPAPAPASPS